ncbi:MAG: DUF47 domain-containing protein [Halanaerobiales bacterium]
MNRLWGDFDKIESDFIKLTECVGKCLEKSFEVITLYIKEGENEKVIDLNKTVHDKESEADDIRRDIVNNITRGSLMPNTRVDILELIEGIDDIADHTEDILDEIIFLQLDFCCLNEEKLKKMIKLIKEQFKKLSKGVNDLFNDMNQALLYASELERIESEVDAIEEDITREIGKVENISTADKLAHRSLVKNVSDTADIIENAGDIIETIVSVRKG